MFRYLNNFNSYNVWILCIIKFHVSCVKDMWKKHIFNWNIYIDFMFEYSDWVYHNVIWDNEVAWKELKKKRMFKWKLMDLISEHNVQLWKKGRRWRKRWWIMMMKQKWMQAIIRCWRWVWIKEGAKTMMWVKGRKIAKKMMRIGFLWQNIETFYLRIFLT